MCTDLSNTYIITRISLSRRISNGPSIFFPLGEQRAPENDESRIIISQPFIDNWSRFNTKWLAFSTFPWDPIPTSWRRGSSSSPSAINRLDETGGEKTRVSLIFLDNLSHSSSSLHFSTSMFPPSLSLSLYFLLFHFLACSWKSPRNFLVASIRSTNRSPSSPPSSSLVSFSSISFFFLSSTAVAFFFFFFLVWESI